MPKVVDPKARRAAVADAVFRLAAREGLPRVSLRTVAAEAGLNVGSVRHYFDSQSELMRFAMRSMIDRVAARLTRRVAEIGDVGALPLEQRRTWRADVLCELLPLDDTRRAEATVYLEFAAAARTDPRLADLAHESAIGTRALVRRALSSITDNELEVQRLVALLDGLALNGVLRPDLLAPEAAAAIVRSHLDQLEASSGPPLP